MSRLLTSGEKRTIRLAGICLGVYLVLFYGIAVRNFFTTRREAYEKLMRQAQDLRNVIKPYEEKVALATNLMDRFRMDPAKLNRSSVVAEASAAIQQAAAAERVEAGPIRETPGRNSSKEAGSIHFEGSGPIPAVLALLHHLDHIGFPVIVDVVQFMPDPRMPAGIKVSLTIVVLDFDAWKREGDKTHV